MAFQIADLITLDPAEAFEFTGAEYAANVYDRLVTYPVDDVADLRGHVAEGWQIADDGRTYTFKIKDGIVFHSGNPLTAADAAWSLQRVIKLHQTPSFILGQFGFTPDNVDERIRVVDERTFTVELDKAYAPTFFLYCLTATVGSVMDRKLVLEHEQNGDMGHQWLRTASAGSGPFQLRSWKPNKSLMIDGNPEYWGGAPGFERVVIRHIAEPATQMLLLEKGDIDIARNLEADQVGIAARQCGGRDQGGAEGRALLSRPQPEERASGQAAGAPGAEVLGRLPGHRGHDPRRLGDRPSGVPATGLPRCHCRPALCARRAPRQGAARRGGPARRLCRDHGHDQYLAGDRHRPRRSRRLSPRAACSSRSGPATTSRR